MKTLLLLPLLLCGSFLRAQDKAALKEISAVFEQIEKEHGAWPHHSYTGENLEGGYAYENHVWQAEDDSGLIRVESRRFDDHGESKTQYFIRGDELLFVLDRVENTPLQPKAKTEVEEKRLYFGGGKLIRLLTKHARFPAGVKTDTSAIGNQEELLSAVEGAGEFYSNYTHTAQAIVAKAASLDSDEADPATSSGSATAGEGWRIIQGSRSRDDKFAFAWGIKGEKIIDLEKDEDGNMALEPDDENLVNYVVNLRTGLIVGKTEGSHWGDKSSLSRFSHEAAWSGTNTFAAQVCSARWATMDANVYHRVNDDPLSPATDIVAPAAEAVFKKLKGSPYLKKHKREDFALTLHDVHFVQRPYGEVMEVGVLGQVPKSDEEHAYFECTVTFAVAEGENGAAPVLTWKNTETHPDAE